MKNNLIIEGLTGAGKSKVITHLVKAMPSQQWQIISEEETFGELMSELDDKTVTYPEKCFRLRNVLSKIESDNETAFLLERFHPSYYAMIPEWNLYREMDNALTRHNFLLVLLMYDEQLFEERAIRRKDGNRTESMVSYWGSFEKVIAACKRSQERTLECLKLSDMRHLVIDTSKMEWEGYAKQILDQLI